MEIAVLDLGSTTFHLQHFLVTEAGIAGRPHDEKRILCLGERVFRNGMLPADAFEESIDACVELVGKARARSPEQLTVVATSAIRSAVNGHLLVRELEQKCRVTVRVVGPDEEARLAYVGQVEDPALHSRRVAVVDLGGGSVEVALGEGVRCRHTESLMLGAMRVRAAMDGTSVDDRLLREVRGLVQWEAGATAERVREFGPDVLVLGSGSARAVRRLAKRESDEPGASGQVDRETLELSLERHLGLSVEELVKRGVEPKRASSVLIATAILSELIDLCGAPPTYVSSRGLRDGVALETHRVITRGPRAVSAMLWG